MNEIIQRELTYLWYYFDLQFTQIFGYWTAGILIGSVISVFAKDWIHKTAEWLGKRLPGIVGLIFASALGILSPLCMYGTIPICAAFSRKGIKDDFLAAFMMSSILLNPQLIIYSTALGRSLLAARILSCFICGITAGILVKCFYCKNALGNVAVAKQATGLSEAKEAAERERAAESPTDAKRLERPDSYFNFSSFDEVPNHDTDPNILLRLLKNIWRNIKATGLWFLFGIALSALFQRYFPAEAVAKLFGKKHEGFALLMAATIGVPLYVCGGGTIPLIIQWLQNGMTYGSAASFMITGPATKITNLGALKIALGRKHFALYLIFVIFFSLVNGALINIFF